MSKKTRTPPPPPPPPPPPSPPPSSPPNPYPDRNPKSPANTKCRSGVAHIAAEDETPLFGGSVTLDADAWEMESLPIWFYDSAAGRETREDGIGTTGSLEKPWFRGVGCSCSQPPQEPCYRLFGVEQHLRVENEDYALAKDCLRHYNSMHPGEEYELAPGKVAQHHLVYNGVCFTFGGFMARRKYTSFCWDAPRTHFFFEHASRDGSPEVVTCAPLLAGEADFRTINIIAAAAAKKGKEPCRFWATKASDSCVIHISGDSCEAIKCVEDEMKRAKSDLMSKRPKPLRRSSCWQHFTQIYSRIPKCMQSRPILVGEPLDFLQLKRHEEECCRAMKPGHFKKLKMDGRLVTICLRYYNSMHLGDEYAPAPGKVTRYCHMRNGICWTHGNFVASRKRSGCFSFLPAPRTLFFFELAFKDGSDQVVTCTPLSDEPVTEAYSVLGFPLWWSTRRSGRLDCICKTCNRRMDVLHPDLKRTFACGHEEVKRVCKMCYHRSNVLHPSPGEFAFGQNNS